MRLIDEIAFQRCDKLLDLARSEFSENPLRSKRYVQLARKIAMKHRLSLGSREFCRKCGVVFVPGRTLKVRVSSKTKSVFYACLQCGAVRKFGYSREKKSVKRASRKS